MDKETCQEQVDNLPERKRLLARIAELEASQTPMQKMLEDTATRDEFVREHIKLDHSEQRLEIEALRKALRRALKEWSDWSGNARGEYQECVKLLKARVTT